MIIDFHLEFVITSNYEQLDSGLSPLHLNLFSLSIGERKILLFHFTNNLTNISYYDTQYYHRHHLAHTSSE